MSTDDESLIELHQYLLNQPDSMLDPLFKMFTFLDLEEVASILEAHSRNPDAKAGQTRLIRELVHQLTASPEAADQVLRYREYFTLDYEKLVK